MMTIIYLINNDSEPVNHSTRLWVMRYDPEPDNPEPITLNFEPWTLEPCTYEYK